MKEIGSFAVCELLDISRYILAFYGVFCLKITSDGKRIIGAVIIFLADIILLYSNAIKMSYWVELLFFAFVIVLLFENKAYPKVGNFLLVFLILDFLDEVSAIILGRLFSFNPLVIAGHNNVGYRIGVYVPSLACLLLLFYVNRKKAQRSRMAFRISTGEYILFTISLVCVTSLVSLISYISFTESKEVLMFYMRSTVFLCIAVVIIVVLLFAVAVNSLRKQQVQKEMVDILKRQAQMQKEYYQRLYEKNEEMREFRHDYHHHTAYLLEQMEVQHYDKAYQYLCHLDAASEKVIGQQFIYSGNSVIDAVIYSILSKKENQEIVLQYEGKLKAHINIEDIDLCSAVSNILENAVEACRECKDKRIVMHAAVHNENLIIQISNTYKEKQIDNSKTSKSDSEFHGYGIKSVMRIIRKYDGSINCFEGDGMYHVMIQFNEKAKR